MLPTLYVKICSGCRSTYAVFSGKNITIYLRKYTVDVLAVRETRNNVISIKMPDVCNAIIVSTGRGESHSSVCWWSGVLAILLSDYGGKDDERKEKKRRPKLTRWTHRKFRLGARRLNNNRCSTYKLSIPSSPLPHTYILSHLSFIAVRTGAIYGGDVSRERFNYGRYRRYTVSWGLVKEVKVLPYFFDHSRAKCVIIMQQRNL